MRKKQKAQISMEFMLSVGLIMMMFIAIMLIVNFRRTEVFEYQEMIELKNPCDHVTSLIANAYALGPGGKIKIDGLDYNITILGKSRLVLVWEKEYKKNRTHYCSFTPFNVTNSYNTSFTIPKRTNITFANNNHSVEVRESVLEDGLVLWFRMDGNDTQTTIKDSSDSKRTGTLNGDADCSLKGFRKESCVFDPTTSDYINTDYYHKRSFGTINYWFNYDTIPAGIGSYIGMKDGSNFEFYLGLPSATALGAAMGKTPFGSVTISPSLQSSTWYMITITGNGSDAAFYLDGAPLGPSTTYNKALANSSFPFKVGKIGATNKYFDGKVDDIRVYDRALSEEEVLRLYNSYLSYVNLTKNDDSFIR